jgi:hypothetical protein
MTYSMVWFRLITEVATAETGVYLPMGASGIAARRS